MNYAYENELELIREAIRRQEDINQDQTRAIARQDEVIQDQTRTIAELTKTIDRQTKVIDQIQSNASLSSKWYIYLLQLF